MSATFKLNSGILTNLSPFIATLQKREHVRPQCFCHFLNYDPGTLCNVSRGLLLGLKRFQTPRVQTPNSCGPASLKEYDRHVGLTPAAAKDQLRIVPPGTARSSYSATPFHHHPLRKYLFHHTIQEANVRGVWWKLTELISGLSITEAPWIAWRRSGCSRRMRIYCRKAFKYLEYATVL